MCHNYILYIYYIGQYGKVFHGFFKRSAGPGGSGTPVAIKTIKQYESEKERDNFLKEMNVMAKLMHPNIVRLFGLVQQGKYIYIYTQSYSYDDYKDILISLHACVFADEPWIVLEYLPHGDLKKFLTVSGIVIL